MFLIFKIFVDIKMENHKTEINENPTHFFKDCYSRIIVNEPGIDRKVPSIKFA